MRLKRMLLWMLLVAVLVPTSWLAGRYAATSWQRFKERRTYAERLDVMNLENDEFRVGSIFPDIPLLSVADSSMTSVYQQISDGGLIIYFSASCPGCEKELAAVQTAIAQARHPKRVILVSPDSWQSLRERGGNRRVDLPVFVDLYGELRANHEFIVIPALVLVDPQMMVVQNSAGGWSVEDYIALLE
jgi:peroxiredoxin